MKKLIFLLAIAAAVAYFLRREDATKLWGSARDTLSSWGEPVTSKAEELADTAAQGSRQRHYRGPRRCQEGQRRRRLVRRGAKRRGWGSAILGAGPAVTDRGLSECPLVRPTRASCLEATANQVYATGTYERRAIQVARRLDSFAGAAVYSSVTAVAVKPASPSASRRPASAWNHCRCSSSKGGPIGWVELDRRDTRSRRPVDVARDREPAPVCLAGDDGLRDGEVHHRVGVDVEDEPAARPQPVGECPKVGGSSPAQGSSARRTCRPRRRTCLRLPVPAASPGRAGRPARATSGPGRASPETRRCRRRGSPAW